MQDFTMEIVLVLTCSLLFSERSSIPLLWVGLCSPWMVFVLRCNALHFGECGSVLSHCSGSVSLFVVLPMRCSGLMLWCPWWAQTLFCRTVSGIVSLLVALPMRCSGLMLCCRWWAQLQSAAWQLWTPLDTGALCAEVQCFKHVLGEWGTVGLFQDLLSLTGFLADGCNAFGCGVLVELLSTSLWFCSRASACWWSSWWGVVLNYVLVVFAAVLRKAPLCCRGAFFAVLVALRLVWLGRAPLCRSLRPPGGLGEEAQSFLYFLLFLGLLSTAPSRRSRAFFTLLVTLLLRWSASCIMPEW